MKIIRCLSEKIQEELEDADAYIDLATAWKDEDEEVAELFYELSTEELGHVDKLHAQVTAEIEEYRRTEGDPPEGMKELYDWMHKKNLEEAMRIRVKQGMFKA